MKSAVFGTVAFLACSSLALAQRLEGGFDKSLSVPGAVELDAMTDSGGIFVTPGPAGAVRVHAILKAQRNSHWDTNTLEQRIRTLEQNPPVEQSGGVIRVGHVNDKNLLRGISMRLEITTPPQTRLKARADSGGIHVSGVEGPVDCQTDSGGIEATDIRSDVKVAADSGGIRVRNARGPVVAHADSGGIELTEIAGSVEAKTDSGGIRISQSSPAPILARADSGGARIKLASSGGYEVKASSDSGRVTVPDIVVHGTVSKRRVEGKLRGGGPLVDVQVDSGNVDIE